MISDYIGEATAYDKKLELERKEPLSWLKSVSAFANTLGGVLIYGVSDDGHLVGLAHAEKDAEDISEIIKNQLDPVPEFDLSFHVENGKKFLFVSVKSGDETPYYVLVRGHRDAYVRIGNESVKADAITLKRLVLRGARLTWDALPSPFKRTNLSFEVLRATYYERTRLEFSESDFLSFGLVDENGELTNAGALLADRSPVRHSRVFCTRWKGLDKANGLMEALDDEEFSGDLITLLASAKSFVRRNYKMPWRKTDDSRLEYPEYPERAYEETLVNGLIHRDYLELGSEVHVDMYDDRMEVYSPGGMPSGRLVQNLDILDIPSMRRNPVIADLFQRMRLMERRGSGFKKIVDAYAFESEKRGQIFKPTLRSDSVAFHVVLPNLNYGVSVNGVALMSVSGDAEIGADGQDSSPKSSPKSSPTSSPNLNETDSRLLQLVEENSKVTILELAHQLQMSRAGVKKSIERVRSAGLLRRVGSLRGGHWKVVRETDFASKVS